MKQIFYFWVLLLALTLLRIFLAATDEITAGEAYFWLLGERWEWASFEGPGGLPALVAILTATLGPKPEYLQMLSPLWLLFASIGLWWWSKRASGPEAAVWVVVVFNCIPWINLHGGEFGPYPLLLAFWIWFWALCDRARGDSSDPGTWWLLAGLAGAGGVFVSYWMLLAPYGIAIYLLRIPLLRMGKQDRISTRGDRSAFALLAILLPALILIGPFWWNVNTSWVAFAGSTFQTIVWPGGEKTILSVASWFFLGGGLLAPALLLVISRIGSLRQLPIYRALLLCAILPAFLFFFLQVWRGEDALLLWMLMVPPALIVGVGLFFSTRVQKPAGALLRGGALAAAVSALFLSVWVLGTPGNLSAPEPEWAQIAERLDRVARIYQPAGADALFLVAGDGAAASGLGFHLLQRETGAFRDFPPVFLRESQNLYNQFGLWPRYDEFVLTGAAPKDEHFQEQQGENRFVGRSAIYLGPEPPWDLPQVIGNGFVRVLPLEMIRATSGEFFYIYYCENYQTAPL